MAGQAIHRAIGVSLRAPEGGEAISSPTFWGLLRRGVYPEPAEGLLATTEPNEFPDALSAFKRLSVLRATANAIRLPPLNKWETPQQIQPRRTPRFSKFPQALPINSSVTSVPLWFVRRTHYSNSSGWMILVRASRPSMILGPGRLTRTSSMG